MSDSELIKHLNDNDFKKETESGFTLVDFHAEWCGPCRMMEPILDEFAQDKKGEVKLAKIDIDANQQTTQQLQVTSVPTMILFKDGEEIERIVGLKDLETLKKIVEDAAAKTA